MSTPKIVQLQVLPRQQWDHDGNARYVEYELLGLDDQGVTWICGEHGWQPHTAALTEGP